MAVWPVRLEGWSNGAAAFAEIDGRKALAPAVCPHDDGVAILEEAARLPGGERHGTAPAGGDLEQAAEPVVARRRDRAGPEQIAWAQIAAAAAVVRHQLCHRPVEMARVAKRQSLRGQPFRLEAPGKH